MNYDADFVEDYIDPYHSDRVDNESVSDLAKMAREQHNQLEEALDIIKDLLPFCSLYSRDAPMMSINERIDVLRLKQ